MKVQDKVSLYCTENNSDKVYSIWLQEEKTGWTVQACWGPRGGSVQSGAKTPKPVPLAEAQKVYAKVLKEKQAKGYTAGKDAPAFSQVTGAVDSGERVMLLTPATEEDLERFVKDNEWAAQEKVNGIRLIVQVRK